MNELADLLEGIPDNIEAIVRLEGGSYFGLSNFEMVDETIYDRDDLCVADIVSIIEAKPDVYKVGNKIEFSVDDVLEVKIVETGKVLYRE